MKLVNIIYFHPSKEIFNYISNKSHNWLSLKGYATYFSTISLCALKLLQLWRKPMYEREWVSVLVPAATLSQLFLRFQLTHRFRFSVSSWEKNLQSFLNEKQNDSYVCWKWWSISEKSPLLQKFDSELIIWVWDSDDFIERWDLYYCWSLSTFCEWRKFICDVNGPMTHSVQKGSQ